MIEIDAFRVPVMIAGIVTASAGLWAAIADIPRGGRRLLGVVLMLKGLNLTVAGCMSARAPDLVGPLLVVQHYLLLAIAPFAVYFLFVYRNSKGPVARRRTDYLVVGLVLLIEGLYMANHGIVLSVAPGNGADGLQTAGPGWVYSGYGPLVWLLPLAAPMYPLIGMALARRAVSGPPEDRTILTLFATGLIVNGVFDGGLATAYLIHDPFINGLSGFGWMVSLMHASSLLPAGIGLGILIGGELTKPMPQRWKIVLPAVLAVAAWFSGPMPVILGAADYGRTWPTAVAIGLWRTVAAIMVVVGLWYARWSLPRDAPTIARVTVRPVAEEA